MTLEQVEQAIYDKYQWWFREAPGVHPREVGTLAQLWYRADYLYAGEKGDE